MGRGGGEEERSKRIGPRLSPKGIHEREMGSNQAFWPKGQENWSREDLSKNKPSSRISIRPTRGRFEPRAWAEEEDNLKKIGK